MIYLDFWIIELLLTWRDFETKSWGTLLSAPINPIKCQCNRGRDWSVATQILSKWSGFMEKVETCFYLITAIHQLRPKWDRTKRYKGRNDNTFFGANILQHKKKYTRIISNFCFLPFYLSTSSNWSQSSVVFLEVESCFYLVISVSFLTGG